MEILFMLTKKLNIKICKKPKSENIKSLLKRFNNNKKKKH